MADLAKLRKTSIILNLLAIVMIDIEFAAMEFAVTKFAAIKIFNIL